MTLSIGLHGGGTRLTWRRMPQDDSLGFSMPHESGFDEAFENLIIALAEGVRPGWVDDALAESVNALRTTLARSAETIRFLAGDHPRTTFRPADLDPDTWAPRAAQTPPPAEFPDPAPAPQAEPPIPLSLSTPSPWNQSWTCKVFYTFSKRLNFWPCSLSVDPPVLTGWVPC